MVDYFVLVIYRHKTFNIFLGFVFDLLIKISMLVQKSWKLNARLNKSGSLINLKILKVNLNLSYTSFYHSYLGVLKFISQ